MTIVTLLGLVAASCTTLAYIPQVVRTLRTRSTSDISLGMFVVMTTGVFLWLVYGVLIRDIPLIAANVVTFLFSLTLLVLKLRNG